MLLEKFPQNPIIKPISHHPWESYLTFNAAALYLDEKIHILYRAMHMLIGISSAEFVHKNAAASSHGFISFFGYIGASFVGIPVGILIDTYKWSGFFSMLIFCLTILLIMICFIAFILHQTHRRRCRCEALSS